MTSGPCGGEQIGTLRQRIGASLRTRVLLAVLLGFAVVAIPAYAAFTWIVNSTVIQLGTLFAEKQVLYDRYRGLEALMREVTLAETLAGTQAIRDWARDENDPEKARRGIAELEHFRQSFTDKSYFFVVGASGNYYFNDAANAYAGDQFRYQLDPGNPRDGWYYNTSALGDGCHLNVDNDDTLRVTKVWMNCVVREGQQVLGILGTGIDLTAFIREVVNVPQVGVTAIFVDREGAVQAHRDRDLVDFHSLTKAVGDRKTVFAMFERPQDQAALRALMRDVAAGETLVKSQFMHMGDKTVLVGVGYLDRLGWYNVTIMDIDAIIDRGLFLPIGLLLAAMMGLVAAMLVVVFKLQVLDRLKGLEAAVRRVEAGDFSAVAGLQKGDGDEIERLSQAFGEMAGAVRDHTRQLESRVRERTRDLEQLAFRDVQTGIANRRGFLTAFEAVSPNQHHGLLLIDIDHFKSINDTFGHAAGDAVIIEIARRIREAVGPANSCARWGGDEFVVLFNGCVATALGSTAFGLMAQICDAPVLLPDGQLVAVTVSVGGCLLEPGETIERATDMADAALYTAKEQGRNRVTIFDPQAGAANRMAQNAR
ncbi:diguanylate cyclase [Devosia limi DSM 17137]|uniref:diguanylate cyclase n=1 Tax=Devosia limi DSM 17137 TaxID=1121477 RepID=A0A0F5LQC6_9HYPH|nr:GGDEF domain-containing protein [Devosia limi]KKB83882.1 diguanylate cyclase [Devosia limi DSM 17137]SHE44483.1 diguanylate cyclase [Devosia limi DSM 17137]